MTAGGAGTRALSPGGLVVVFLLVLAAFVARPFLIGGDEPHYAAMASSLAFDRDFALANQYREIEHAGSFAAGKRFANRRLERHLVEKANGPQFSHALGLPLLAAPVLFVGQRIGRVPWPDPLLGALAVVASFLGLLCGLDLLQRFLGDPAAALSVAALLFFASPLWFYSRTFFTEPFAWSALVGGVWFLARRRWLAGGLLFGLALAVREPTLTIVAPLLAGVGLSAGGAAAAGAAVGPALALGLVAARNLLLNGGGLFDFPQPFRYGDLPAGAVGLLFDLGHGLLLFAPIVLLAPAGLFLARQRSDRLILGCSVTAFALYFLLAAAWTDWRGGASFGPRLLLPALPLLAPPIALAWRRWRRGFAGALFLAASAVAAGIEVAALANPFQAFWSSNAVDLILRSPSSVVTFAAGALAALFLFRKLNSSRSPA